jgi:hypothetical protein
MSANAATRVVVVGDSAAAVSTVPSDWPAGPQYLKLNGGYAGWHAAVIEPQPPAGYDAESRALAARIAQISAYFTGTAAQATEVVAPPPTMSGGTGPRRKAGGC